MDAMAATAINEAISVYSTTVAPWVFFIRRRKKDSMISLADSTKGGPGPLLEPLREETYSTLNLTSIKTLRKTSNYLKILSFGLRNPGYGCPEAEAGEDAGQPGKGLRKEAEQHEGDDGLRAFDEPCSMLPRSGKTSDRL